MRCPKCGKEMTAGFLQSDNCVGITWVPQILPFGLGYWKLESETVSTEMSVGVNGLSAHICKDCKVLFGDYSQKK